ncbi:DUF4142 domain-containing protein [Streptomyces sp900105245]|uniref:DUF4142 domain-containing protein n=1 Tax=Streptomyces sp. 900105245 TaxID=3154379 RepID=A0ABV1UJQ9_9ACTN
MASEAVTSVVAANLLPPTDRDFLLIATTLYSTQIDAAKLAKRNTDDEDVNLFARRMTTDFVRLFLKMKAIAPRSVIVPRDNSHNRLLQQLLPLSGPKFDHTYVTHFGLRLPGHSIAAFNKEVTEGEEPSLQKAAQNALHTLLKHQSMGEELARKKSIT